MAFIDFHCDTASILLEDKTQGLKNNNLKVDINKLIKGGALAQFFALFIHKERGEGYNEKTIRMLNNLKNEFEINKGTISLCTNYNDYRKTTKEGKVGAFITIEEGEALEGNIDNLRFFKENGVSLITLTWNYENNIGFPNAKPKFKNQGLKPFGIEVVKEMNNLGMIIDVSHLSDGGFWDVVKYSKKPFIASHSNARMVWNHGRNMDDEMIKALSEKGGVMGINFCGHFLGESKIATIEDMITHILHIKRVGGMEVIALGSDFDGIENEVEIRNISEMDKLSDALLKSGFTSSEIDKIFYKNAERIIKEVLI